MYKYLKKIIWISSRADQETKNKYLFIVIWQKQSIF